MNIMQCEATNSLIRLYQKGLQLDWMGVPGGSVSRWLTVPEMMAVQSELDFNSTEYVPLLLDVPELARECFMYCCPGDNLHLESSGFESVSTKILQVAATGDRCRVLWENGEPNRSPLEISMHIASHSSHAVGQGSVVYHCQPINTMALVALAEGDAESLMSQLKKGYAAIINILPDGLGIIPWGMTKPLRHGERLSQEVLDSMKKFVDEVGKGIRSQEALILRGEGLICASAGEREVFNIITAIERASSIRLKILSAGGE